MKKMFGLFLIVSGFCVMHAKEQEPRAKSSLYIITINVVPSNLHEATGWKRLLPITAIDPVYGGFFATYAGNAATFNADGSLVFPRRHATDKITYLITPEIIPVILRGQTVEYLAFDPELPSACYEFVRMEDKKTGVFVWKVTKVPSPKKEKLDPYTVIFCAHPDELIIHEGIFLTSGGQNLLMPTIYWKENPHEIEHLSSFVRINRYFQNPFAPLKMHQKILADRYSYFPL